MPVVLQSGEELEFKHDVNTPFGPGALHVTNHGLIIDVKKGGIVFHRWHNQMAGIEAKGLRGIKVRWPEGSQMHEFEFKAWGSKEIVKRIKQKHDYSNNFSAEGGSRVMFDEKQREEIRKERSKWVARMLKRAEKELDREKKRVKKGEIQEADPELARDVESWKLMGEEAVGAVVNRSMKVPERVPDHLVWHDAWLDGDYFYTFNQAWLDDRREYVKARDSEADEKTGAYRIPAEYVRFFHGYPYVRGNALATPDRFKVGWLVPTMTEEMIDVDMTIMFHRPRYRMENKIMIGESVPAILGHTTDLEYLNNAKLNTHAGTLRWLHEHGRLDVRIVEMMGFENNFDYETVKRRVADLKY
ncbi:MAG: hypothetical protein OXK17_06500 [Thaumarchaeota archaeon]|nr:hypothetical protein [Nitrososphaerota archaeon]